MPQNKNMRILLIVNLFFGLYIAKAQTLLVPDRVFDGIEMHGNWVVYVVG